MRGEAEDLACHVRGDGLGGTRTASDNGLGEQQSDNGLAVTIDCHGNTRVSHRQQLHSDKHGAS